MSSINHGLNRYHQFFQRRNQAARFADAQKRAENAPTAAGAAGAQAEAAAVMGARVARWLASPVTGSLAGLLGAGNSVFHQPENPSDQAHPRVGSMVDMSLACCVI